ncbi:MAG: hypothetical protein L0H63_15875, partial [Nitrococcus sp.]|nr:hypothetical protein [Nitrococcus sp.]
MTRMKIRRVGNSHGVIIPQGVMRALDLHQDDELSIARLRGGELRLRRVRAHPVSDTPAGMIHRHL